MDSQGNSVQGFTVKAYDKHPWFDIFGNDALGSAVTLDDGTFRIQFSLASFKKPIEV